MVYCMTQNNQKNAKMDENQGLLRLIGKMNKMNRNKK